MRRLPLLELIMLGVVALAMVLALRASKAADRAIAGEEEAFATISRLDGTGPLPAGLEPISCTPAREREGYLFVGYVPSREGPRAVDPAEVLDGEGPYLVLAWPRRYPATGRRAYLLRSPGFVLRSENEVRPLSGLPVPRCPWSLVTEPQGDPPDPEVGAPEGWTFRRREDQRERLRALGLWRDAFLAPDRPDDD